jgi:DNA polymerase-4
MGRARHRPDDIDAVVMGLVDRVTGRMRKGDRIGRTVVLRLRFDDFSRISRSRTLPRATADTATILATVRSLVQAATPLIASRGLTLVGIAVGNLDDESLQLELPFDERNLGALDSALDGVRERFGSSSVTRAVLLHRRQHIEMPLLPE